MRVDSPVRAPARGPRIYLLRYGAILFTLLITVAAVAGGQGRAFAGALVLTQVALQLLLLRPAVVVVDGRVVLQGPFRRAEFDRAGVRRFFLSRRRVPLDVLCRSVVLGLELTSGDVVEFRWIGWQDMTSAFVGNSDRPLTRRQRRLLTTLNSALERECDEPHRC